MQCIVLKTEVQRGSFHPQVTQSVVLNQDSTSDLWIPSTLSYEMPQAKLRVLYLLLGERGHC